MSNYISVVEKCGENTTVTLHKNTQDAIGFAVRIATENSDKPSGEIQESLSSSGGFEEGDYGVSICPASLPPSKSGPTQTCEFVELTSLVPKSWSHWFYCLISENAPFSWGDNNRTMVTASCFASHCDDALELEGSSHTSRASISKFLKKLRSLGETYIDLEN